MISYFMLVIIGIFREELGRLEPAAYAKLPPIPGIWGGVEEFRIFLSIGAKWTLLEQMFPRRESLDSLEWGGGGAVVWIVLRRIRQKEQTLCF